MPFRILVDRNLCESNFQCQNVDPNHFVIDEENDELIIPHEVVSDDHAELVHRAAELCPKGALRIESVNDGTS